MKNIKNKVCNVCGERSNAIAHGKNWCEFHFHEYEKRNYEYNINKQKKILKNLRVYKKQLKMVSENIRRIMIDEEITFLFFDTKIDYLSMLIHGYIDHIIPVIENGYSYHCFDTCMECGKKLLVCGGSVSCPICDNIFNLTDKQKEKWEKWYDKWYNGIEFNLDDNLFKIKDYKFMDQHENFSKQNHEFWYKWIEDNDFDPRKNYECDLLKREFKKNIMGMCGIPQRNKRNEDRVYNRYSVRYTYYNDYAIVKPENISFYEIDITSDICTAFGIDISKLMTKYYKYEFKYISTRIPKSLKQTKNYSGLESEINKIDVFNCGSMNKSFNIIVNLLNFCKNNDVKFKVTDD